MLEALKNRKFFLSLLIPALIVSQLFSILAALIGVFIVIAAILLASVEPFSAAVFAFALFALTVFITDPVTAAGAGLVFVCALIAGTIILLADSSKENKDTKKYRDKFGF